MQSQIKSLYISNNVAIVAILIEKHVLSTFDVIFFFFNDNAEVYPDELKLQFI